MSTGVNQDDRTIVINASGNTFQTDGVDRCYMKPLRNFTGPQCLYYNPVTFEVTYGSKNSSVSEIVDNTVPTLFLDENGIPNSIKYKKLTVFLFEELNKLRNRIEKLERKVKVK